MNNQTFISQIPTTEVRSIGPEEAERILTMNTNNRPIATKHVDDLAGRMRNGEWELNGQGIIISDTGRLLDGQHRLHAIVKSGVTIDLFVVTGVKDDAFTTLDDGRKRQLSDLLAIDGVLNYAPVAAACRIVMSVTRPDKENRYGTKSGVSNSELHDFFHKHSGITEFVHKSYDYYTLSGRLISQSEILAFMYLTNKVDAEKSEEFWEKLMLGGNDRECPTFKLRTMISLDKSSTNRKMKRTIRWALIVKCWNLYRSGQTVVRLSFYPDRNKWPSIFD